MLRSALRQFVLNGDAGSDPDDILRLPGSAFAVSDVIRSITLRRLWLDTFDWRLYRSGLTLEQVSSRGAAEVVLTGRDGALIAAEPLGRRHPGGRGENRQVRVNERAASPRPGQGSI